MLAPMTGLRGVFAAAVTPLLDGGTRLDEPGIAAVADYLAAAGVDGALVCGTAGEGIALSVAERRRALETYIAAGGPRLALMAHCGAQTTADTVALAEHAAEAGAVGVSVIAPPYFPLDERALLEHLAAAAQACAPLPFYIYCFTARSGYPIPLAVIERLRERVSNLAGLKVSEAPWERFEPYLLDGLDIFVGPESLIAQGARGRRDRCDLRTRVGVPRAGGGGRARAARPRRPSAPGRCARDARALPDAGRAEDRVRAARRAASAATCARRCARSTPTSEAELEHAVRGLLEAAAA